MVRFLFILFFIGCSATIPKWYTKIYNDNKNFIYATGEGYTKKEAINNALANASAKIAIEVKSIYKNIKYQYKEKNNITSSNTSFIDIQTKTKPIIFNSYKLLKLQKEDKYYVLLKIDRYKNAKFMCQKIQMPQINNDDIYILLNYKKILKNLNQKIDQIQTINTLYPVCGKKLNQITNLKDKIIKKYNSLTYSIYSNDKKIKSIISSNLDIKNSKNGKIKIIINTKWENKKVGAYFIAILNLNIKLTNSSSKEYILTCASSSIQDYKTAKELAYKKCEEKIKKIFNN